MNPVQIVQVVAGILPEVMAFIRGFHSANGTLPTDQQVIDGLNVDSARVISIGQAWLDSHPPAK